MDMIQAINSRISRRTYLETPIAPEKMKKLLEEIDKINEESGLNITFLENGADAFEGAKSYGMFKGVHALFVLKGKKDMEHLKEKVGYYGERLILLAESLDLGTCWVGGTFDKNSEVFHVPAEEQIICVVPVGNVSESALKEKMIREMVHHKTKSIEEMIHTDRPLTEEETEAMHLVQLAPTAKNTQKVEFIFHDNTIIAQVPDDYPFDLVDLGICKLHFEAGMKSLFNRGHFPFGNRSAFTAE